MQVQLNQTCPAGQLKMRTVNKDNGPKTHSIRTCLLNKISFLKSFFVTITDFHKPNFPFYTNGLCQDASAQSTFSLYFLRFCITMYLLQIVTPLMVRFHCFVVQLLIKGQVFHLRFHQLHLGFKRHHHGHRYYHPFHSCGQAVYSLFHYESLQCQSWYIPRHIFNLFHIPLHSLVCTSSCFSASQRLAGRATSSGRHGLDCSFTHSLLSIRRCEQRPIHPNHRAKTMCGYDERGKLYDRTVQQQGKCSSPLNSFVFKQPAHE